MKHPPILTVSELAAYLEMPMQAIDTATDPAWTPQGPAALTDLEALEEYANDWKLEPGGVGARRRRARGVRSRASSTSTGGPPTP